MAHTQEQLEPSPWLRRGAGGRERGSGWDARVEQHATAVRVGPSWAGGRGSAGEGLGSGLCRSLPTRTRCGGSEVILLPSVACPSTSTRAKHAPFTTRHDATVEPHAAHAPRPVHRCLEPAQAVYLTALPRAPLNAPRPPGTMVCCLIPPSTCNAMHAPFTLHLCDAPANRALQSTWHALNVEPEFHEEDDVDDTKEIQIEEALKLYQTALKYHSEGPQSFQKTGEAYRALFESEIFKYNESLSEYRRHELFGDELVFDSILDDYETGPVQQAGGNESAPNTLPQILHLSHKNHGQFLLETLQHWATQNGAVLQQDGAPHLVEILGHFADALDKEDTDLDLWLRTASVAAMLGSSRITRFCLEAVLDGNDELYDSLLRLPGLEEGFAGHQLRELVSKLEDTLSLHQPPLSSMKKKKLSEKLKQRLNPYPWAPLPSDISAAISPAAPRPPQRVVLSPPKWDWAGVGDAILRHYMTETNSLIDDKIPPAAGITLDMPPQITAPELTEDARVQEEIAAQEPSEEEPVLDESEKTLVETENEPVKIQSGEDVVMEDQEKATGTKGDDGELATPVENARDSSRKRSTDSAGLPETAEGGRARSKRLRAREATEPSAAVEAVGQAVGNTLEDQLWPFTNADRCLREVINDQFERLGVEGFGKLEELHSLVTNFTPGKQIADSIDKAACDMYTALQSSGSKIAPVMLSAEPVDLGGATREAGLNAFLGYSKSSIAQACVKPILQSEKLASFVQDVNDAWLSTNEVAFSWVETLLSPSILSLVDDSTADSQSSYVQYRWPEDLKRHLIQVLVNVDEFIYNRMLERLETLNTGILNAQAEAQQYQLTDFDLAQIEMIETIFELHLDVYSLIKHPSSGVDQNTQLQQSDRLARWVSLAREAMQLRSSCKSSDVLKDDLSLRHIWASVFHLNVSDDVLPQHVLYAMEELKEIFKSLDGRVIEIQNNAVMPELSVAAVDRELVRISMKDFFLTVFDTDEKDPVAVIESLEPILEPTQASDMVQDEDSNAVDEAHDSSSSPSTVDGRGASADIRPSRPSPLQEMRKFLDSAAVHLRLSLWQRLREAYEGIEYAPKVLSCYLRSIETLTGEFGTSTYRDASDPDRHVKLVRCFRLVDEIVVKVLSIIRNEKDAFACLTYEHMQSSMSAVSQLLRILSASNCLQDMIRVGQYTAPRIEGLPSSTFNNMTNRLNDVQVRLWILQYHLFKEGMAQTPESFEVSSDEQFTFLRHVHHALGVRSCGHSAGRLFLRLAKDEMLVFKDLPELEVWATELSQVLYDLYGLKTFVDPAECQEYDSNADILDKSAATKLISFIITQANKMNIKDLAKHELKNTIERVHGALGRPKLHEDITQNGKTLKAYLKSPINPTDLFNSLKGVNSIPTKPIPAEISPPAAKGWYFLMGNLALNKFKGQKRTTQAPTEDVHFAQAFFEQDLVFSSDSWETWYRLAQANDTQLEEAVSWTVEKINSNSMELITWQRAAIHCYTMAVACAVRDADTSPSTCAKVAHLYTDFGTRVYASSREPFNMNVFDVKDVEHKFFSNNNDNTVYKNLPFAVLTPYQAWKFAGTLFKRATKGNPDKWWNHYMLAKCLWKMYCYSDDEIKRAASEFRLPQANIGQSWAEVIKATVNAINTLPEKKERGKEPVLEPHYKLVSITHKLYQRKAVDEAKGVEMLSNTPFAENITSLTNVDEWEGYILSVLKALRKADNSSWHHRIIARAAHVIYDKSTDMSVAQAAKHELTQQIFTKTMAVQVWKPEHERPGRHFVYTTRYTRFFVNLLVQTNDQPNLEALARRVRRKQTDFFEHTMLWQDLCRSYLQLLRRMGQVPDGQEDTIFRTLNFEEYNVQATRLEAWCQDPNTSHPALDTLRHVVELKRINNGLMKAVSIDDVLGDTFALLYNTIGPTLPPLPQETQPPPAPQAPLESSAAAPPPLPVPSIAQGQIDGAAPPNTHNNPFTLYHPTQPNPPPPPPPVTEPVPKPRAKTVGRREIQRRAEACAQKPAGAPAPSTTMPIRSPPANASAGLAPSTTMSTATATATATATPTAHQDTTAGANSHDDKQASPDAQPAGTSTSTSTNANTHLPMPMSMSMPIPNSLTVPPADTATTTTTATTTAAASVADEPRSAEGSVHDDADDESELSELDDEEVQDLERTVEERVRSVAGGLGARGGLFGGVGRRNVEVVEEEGEEEEEEEEEEGGEEEGDTEMGDGE